MGNGFFSAAVSPLPHPPIPLAIFLIVEAAVSVAWERLKSQGSSRIDLKTATEDQITHELYEILFDEVYEQGLVDGFDDVRFTVVTREAKVRNFDGTHLDKMPDLLIGLADREDILKKSQDWIFVECKPIGSTHTVGVHYGAKGIARFIKGEYAWAMPSALMIGYADSGYDILPKLADALAQRRDEFHVLDAPIPCIKSQGRHKGSGLHVTRHSRPFKYIETGQDAPPILLRHLWLQRF
jgi:hypothetical protein